MIPRIRAHGAFTLHNWLPNWLPGSLAGGLLLVGVACSPKAKPNSDAPPIQDPRLAAFFESAQAFSPLPAVPADPTNRWADSEPAARLGQRLFFNTRLGASEGIACITCHQPANGFADVRSLSHGLGDNTRHAPTLLHAAHQRWFGWGGLNDSLWSQALGPLEAPFEMNGNRVAIVRRVLEDAVMGPEYESLFGEGPDLTKIPRAGLPQTSDSDGQRADLVVAWESMSTEQQRSINQAFANLGKALAAFERKLEPGPAPFDRLVDALRAGRDPGAARLSDAALRGFDLFRGAAGCVVCHSGPLFSDGEFHNTGAPTLRGGNPIDPGRYRDGARLQQNPFHAHGEFSDDPSGQTAERTRLLKVGSEQWGEFKTPSLRNLGLTAPFNHQGQFETLAEVLHFYNTLEGSVGASHHQEQILRPLRLTPGQLGDLAAFLESLEGSPIPPMWASPPER